MRNRILGGWIVASLVVMQPAFAKKVGIPNYQTAQKALQSDVVVVGKVTTIEAEAVELPAYAGAKEKVAFKIATVKIETSLNGAKNLTHIKVAFPLTANTNRPRADFGPIGLTEGQEGIFFLQNNVGTGFMRIPEGFTPISLDAANYKDELAKTTATAAIIADPLKALKAEKLADRQTAVSILGQKYRQPMSGGEMVEEALPAEQTKLILATILEIDWKQAEMPPPGFDFMTSGPNLASMWGLQAGQFGIPKIQVKQGENYNVKLKQALDAWAKTDGEKLELKKFVAKAKPEK